METIILRVVSKYLGLIVKNFTNEQAKLSLRKGEAALRDIGIHTAHQASKTHSFMLLLLLFLRDRPGVLQQVAVFGGSHVRP